MAPRKKATPAVDTTETIETKAAASESVAVDAAAETTPVKKTRTRKTAAKAAEATAAEEVKTTKTTTKKAAAKKADESKTAAKTTTKKTAAKKAVEAEAAAPAPKAEIFIEYGGVQVSVDEIISNARKIVGNNRDIKIYVQPDTSKAYIAFDGESVSMDVFFCK